MLARQAHFSREFFFPRTARGKRRTWRHKEATSERARITAGKTCCGKETRIPERRRNLPPPGQPHSRHEAQNFCQGSRGLPSPAVPPQLPPALTGRCPAAGAWCLPACGPAWRCCWARRSAGTAGSWRTSGIPRSSRPPTPLGSRAGRPRTGTGARRRRGPRAAAGRPTCRLPGDAPLCRYDPRRGPTHRAVADESRCRRSAPTVPLPTLPVPHVPPGGGGGRSGLIVPWGRPSWASQSTARRKARAAVRPVSRCRCPAPSDRAGPGTAAPSAARACCRVPQNGMCSACGRGRYKDQRGREVRVPPEVLGL